MDHKTDTDSERRAFEAWLPTEWSRETFTEDGCTLYVEDWVQGAFVAFRDLRASLAASAGSEPVAWLVTGGQIFVDSAHTSVTSANAAAMRNTGAAVKPLYTHPSPPEGMVGGWRPIAEAPQDDTVVDIWRPSWGGERCPDMRRVDLGGGNVCYDPVLAGPTCVRDATHFMIVRPPIAAGGGLPPPPLSEEGASHG